MPDKGLQGLGVVLAADSRQVGAEMFAHAFGLPILKLVDAGDAVKVAIDFAFHKAVEDEFIFCEGRVKCFVRILSSTLAAKSACWIYDLLIHELRMVINLTSSRALRVGENLTGSS